VLIFNPIFIFKRNRRDKIVSEAWNSFLKLKLGRGGFFFRRFVVWLNNLKIPCVFLEKKFILSFGYNLHSGEPPGEQQA